MQTSSHMLCVCRCLVWGRITDTDGYFLQTVITTSKKWCCRKTIRISWTYRVTNQDELNRIGRQPTLLKVN